MVLRCDWWRLEIIIADMYASFFRIRRCVLLSVLPGFFTIACLLFADAALLCRSQFEQTPPLHIKTTRATIIHHGQVGTGQIQHRPLDGRRESSPPRRPRAPRPGLGRHQPPRRDQVRIRIATYHDDDFDVCVVFGGSRERICAQDTGTFTDG